jgi:general stress protein YciG
MAQVGLEIANYRFSGLQAYGKAGARLLPILTRKSCRESGRAPTGGYRRIIEMAERATQERRKGRGRGFASMDREKQREIASRGGRAAHEQGTAHEWNSDEARVAGRKGGSSSHGAKVEA